MILPPEAEAIDWLERAAMVTDDVLEETRGSLRKPLSGFKKERDSLCEENRARPIKKGTRRFPVDGALRYALGAPCW